MELKKITENNYNLYKEADYYVLALGAIKRGENTETEIEISGVDAKNVTVNGTCGCTAVKNETVNESTVRTKIKYKDCDRSFTKTVRIVENSKVTLLKIKGTCQ